MPLGVILAFIAFVVFSVADALIKTTGSGLSVFEIAFFTTTFSIIPLALFNRQERWRGIYKLRHPWLVHLRCGTTIAGTACVMYAFTHIAFADVYAIGFMTPLFVTLLSVLLLHEKVALHRWALLLISFLGVVLVVRPGFNELAAGHCLMLLGAILGAITNTILRHVAASERRISLVGLPVLYSAVVNGLLMIPTFVVPSLEQMALMLANGLCAGTAWLLLIQASKLSPASLIAPVQYTQLVWAMLFGALLFGEYPDGVAIIGMMVVVTAGLFNVVTEKWQIRRRPRVVTTLATAMREPLLVEEPTSQPQVSVSKFGGQAG
ncbi:DMT family transporter [Devosia sp. A369]